MKPRRYSSYTEIDNHLQVLKLEREIHFQKAKLGIEKAKENLKLGNLAEGYLHFSKSNSSFIGRVLKIALPFVLRNFFRRK